MTTDKGKRQVPEINKPPKLGIAVNGVGASQLSFNLIRNANELVIERPDLDVAVFYENLQKPCLAMTFACMQIVEGWAFDGPVVATTLSTAQKILRFPSSPKKYFYVWDLEWLRLSRPDFRELAHVYRHPELTLLARNHDHAQAISQCWNRDDIRVVENFDLTKIINEALPV